MTFRQALHEFLRDTIDVPVYDARLPLRPMMPALVQSFVAASSIHTHSGPSTLLERRVQIDAFANNDPEADQLAARLLYALDGYHGTMNGVDVGYVELVSDVEMDPAEIKGGEVRYRRVLDFMVGYQDVQEVSS